MTAYSLLAVRYPSVEEFLTANRTDVSFG